MPSYHEPISFTYEGDTLDTVFRVLANHRNDDYYAYERAEHWYIGIGSHSSFTIDSKGDHAIITTESGQKSYAIDRSSITATARNFVSENIQYHDRIFGQAGFNYAAYIRGQAFQSGEWPLLSMMIPRIEIVIHQGNVILTGSNPQEMSDLRRFLQEEKTASLNLTCSSTIDVKHNGPEYRDRVEKAQSDIDQGLYKKVILSRAVEITDRLDLLATLIHGRRSNNPSRSFALNHMHYQATGFSPELVMSVKSGKVITEPLAGTRSCKGAKEEVDKLRAELQNDPKEIVEHVISVKEAIQELGKVCPSDHITIEDFMSVRSRGSVQHLGSRVAGLLSPDKDIWDAFNVLFPSITASGIPKSTAMDAIHRLEDRPRELYSGAVIMLEGPDTFEAALVLRTAFQDPDHQWIQAGAGIISQSDPQREFDETCEKLASIAPFVVSK